MRRMYGIHISGNKFVEVDSFRNHTANPKKNVDQKMESI